MAGKFALIIGNSEYQDPNLTRLKAPEADVEGLSALLRDPLIGAFDEVITLANELSATIRRTIGQFFAEKTTEDLLVLYFSGHGVLDDNGELFLATKDTERDLISATAIPAAFVTGQMDRSRSKRQVLILDCCHSGAFARGSKGVVGASVGTATAFEGTGYGRVVLTATDATQFAWEGDQVIGSAENSLFTHFMIEGIQTGQADTDGDGRISIENLYDYVYDRVVQATPKQTPGKWSYKQQGEIVIANNPNPATKPAELPRELREAVESPVTSVRADAVRELERLLNGTDPELSLAALDALKRLDNDDSHRVANAATQVLNAYNAAVPATDRARKEQELLAWETAEAARAARERAEQERVAKEKAEAERLGREQAEQERIAKEQAEAERLAREKKAQAERVAEAPSVTPVRKAVRTAAPPTQMPWAFLKGVIGILFACGLLAVAAGVNTLWNRITGPAPTKVIVAPVPTSPPPGPTIALVASGATASPPSGRATLPISLVLSGTLPRQVRYAGLLITINRAEITNRDPAATDLARQYRTDQAYAILDTTVKNTETATEVNLNFDPVRLRLADGKSYQPTAGWRTFHQPQSSEDVKLVFGVPLAATWQGAQFLVSQPNKEPAILPLDGVIPTTPYPLTVKDPGQATVQQTVFKVTSVSLDLDWNGTRADAGKRFLIFSLHVTNSRTDGGSRNITWNDFRLFVDGEPLAPRDTTTKFLEATSSADLRYAFLAPADFGKVELQVGAVAGATAKIPIAIKAQ